MAKGVSDQHAPPSVYPERPGIFARRGSHDTAFSASLTSSHRKYSTTGDIANFHTTSPKSQARSYISDSSSYIGSASSFARSAQDRGVVPRSASPTKAYRGRGVHPLSSASRAKEDVTEPGSPSKRALSPAVAAKLALFSDNTVHNPNLGKDVPTVPLSFRARTKSLSNSETTSSSIFPSSNNEPPMPSFQATLPVSKSTGELVRLYEQRSALPDGIQTPRSASPVKSWLKHVRESASESDAGRSNRSSLHEQSAADAVPIRRQRTKSTPSVSVRSEGESVSEASIATESSSPPHQIDECRVRSQQRCKVWPTDRLSLYTGCSPWRAPLAKQLKQNQPGLLAKLQSHLNRSRRIGNQLAWCDLWKTASARI
jgi:hypothetical protein